MIINTIGVLGLWYTATVLPMPNWVHTTVTKAIFDFLWNGKTESVKRATCHLSRGQGGLSVIHELEKSRALKLRWVPCVGDSSCESKWVFVVRYWIDFQLSWKMKNWTFLRSNSSPKYMGDNQPLVYNRILRDADRIGLDFDLLPNHSVKTF